MSKELLGYPIERLGSLFVWGISILRGVSKYNFPEFVQTTSIPVSWLMEFWRKCERRNKEAEEWFG